MIYNRHLLSIGMLIFTDPDFSTLPKLTLKTLVSSIELTALNGFQNVKGQCDVEELHSMV